MSSSRHPPENPSPHGLSVSYAFSDIVNIKTEVSACMHGTDTALCIFSLDNITCPTPVLLPGKSHGRGSLVGYSPWGHEESDTTEQLHLHFSLLCIGGGNGNPLQYSCLENPRDRGAWWAAVYGVTQSQTHN